MKTRTSIAVIGLCALLVMTSAVAEGAVILESGIISGYSEIADCVVNNMGTTNVTLNAASVQIIDALDGTIYTPTTNTCQAVLQRGKLCIVAVDFNAVDYRAVLCRVTLPVTLAVAEKNFRARVELLQTNGAAVIHAPVR